MVFITFPERVKRMVLATSINHKKAPRPFGVRAIYLHGGGKHSAPSMALPLRASCGWCKMFHTFCRTLTQLLIHTAFLQPIKNPKHFCLGFVIGGGGGNRTRVRKSATRGPTCVVSSLIYPCRYRRTGATRGARD